MKAKDMDKKNMDKCRNNADFFCQQLGKYRMPFAWTAIGVLDILAGNQVSSELCHAFAVRERYKTLSDNSYRVHSHYVVNYS